MKSAACLLLLGFVSVIVSGCVVTHPRVAPPPPRVEVVGVKPGLNFVWIAGYWGWSGGAYAWAPGHWVKAKPGKAWVAGHWERKGNHWAWKRGHWR